MTALEIPDRAARAACDAYDDALTGDNGALDTEHAEITGLRAGAPIVVATELRRFTEELLELWRVLTERNDLAVGLAETIRRGRERADQLDPEGMTP